MFERKRLFKSWSDDLLLLCFCFVKSMFVFIFNIIVICFFPILKDNRFLQLTNYFHTVHGDNYPLLIISEIAVIYFSCLNEESTIFFVKW